MYEIELTVYLYAPSPQVMKENGINSWRIIVVVVGVNFEEERIWEKKKLGKQRRLLQGEW